MDRFMTGLLVGFLFGVMTMTGVILGFYPDRKFVSAQYRECVALGAPPENCLKKYVLGEDEK